MNTHEWLPIETAPKDGREILVSDGQWIWLTRWGEGSYAEDGWIESVDDGMIYLFEPILTHWIPLPEPPK